MILHDLSDLHVGVYSNQAEFIVMNLNGLGCSQFTVIKNPQELASLEEIHLFVTDSSLYKELPQNITKIVLGHVDEECPEGNLIVISGELTLAAFNEAILTFIESQTDMVLSYY